MLKNDFAIEIMQYLRGYSYGIELYPPDLYVHYDSIVLQTPFQQGYRRGSFDYYCLLTGALPEEIV